MQPQVRVVLPKVSSDVAAVYAVLLRARHRKPHSMHQEHQVGTNGCSLGTSMVISFPPQTGSASGKLMDDHPS